MRATVLATHIFAVTGLALGLAACGGGGRSDDGASSPPPPRVIFAANATRTVFGSGVLDFDVSPPLGDGESAVCTLSGAPVEPCMLDASTGRVAYNALEAGPHVLEVEIRREQGAAASWEHVIERVDPTIVVFGATPAGITAAIAAARANQSVALLEPTRWVGGMMAAGLTKTDTGTNGHLTIRGIADEFFRRVSEAEQVSGAHCGGDFCNSLYDFAPHTAEQVFEEMLAEATVIVERDTRLLGAERAGEKILAVVTSRGQVPAGMFIDASYEGDLMAAAGIDYRLGREPRLAEQPPDDAAQLADYEEHAGVRRYRVPRSTHVDPYVVPGDPSSGTLPYIEPRPDPLPTVGAGDSRVMAYTYRLCVTDDPSNRIPFDPPEDFDPWEHEANARLAVAFANRGIDLSGLMFNPFRTALSKDPAYFKYDLNGGSTFSSDMTAPDLNQAYIEGSEAERERIRSEYRRYIQGMLYFWRTDPRFGTLNQEVERFGYCKDEFVDRGGWPHQLYVRVARRMVGEYVMNENDVMRNGRRPPIADPVGFGSYGLDMHAYRYFAAPVNWPDGTRRDAIVLEGYLIQQVPENWPYPISYRSLVPKRGDAANFLNPVTLSATNVAMSSIRMEPTFMVLGQAAGTAAALALEAGQAVQDVSYELLRERLLQGGQRLEL